jgi:probable rRNA maturation factor
MKNIAARLAQTVSNSVSVHNRQRVRTVDTRFLRGLTRWLLSEALQVQKFQLTICVVGTEEMTHLNETFLKHKGSTDVLAFDYSEDAEPTSVIGEICVCAEEAMIQSARFRTDWRSELVRYVVHGTLHLLGYDDHGLASRRQMKRVENQTLRRLAGRFDLKQLSPWTRVTR